MQDRFETSWNDKREGREGMQGTDNLEKRRRIIVLCDLLNLCSSPEQGLSFVLDNQGCGSKGWRRREPITNAARGDR